MVTTAWVEEGATVELFVVLDVCVLEVTGARFDFLLSGEEVVGAESFVFFFFLPHSLSSLFLFVSYQTRKCYKP